MYVIHTAKLHYNGASLLSFRDFTVFNNYLYGNCYTYNTGAKNKSIKTVNKIGPLYGMYDIICYKIEVGRKGSFSEREGERAEQKVGCSYSSLCFSSILFIIDFYMLNGKHYLL